MTEAENSSHALRPPVGGLVCHVCVRLGGGGGGGCNPIHATVSRLHADGLARGDEAEVPTAARVTEAEANAAA